MPKSAKRKKEKTADFTKAKLKLGKGKQIASNAVDTSFKVRSIALPKQSISVNQDHEVPTTKRRLTLNNLQSQLHHHNASTRKDALLGLREILEEHPWMIESSLTSLLGSCIRMISDEDAAVRKALLSLMSWLLSEVSRVDILPHASVLMLFVTSAQTHIFPAIRVDAIKFIDALLDLIPEVVVHGWTSTTTDSTSHGSRVLQGYLALLNVGGQLATSEKVSASVTPLSAVTLSQESRAVVLNSLAHFLRVSLREQQTDSVHEQVPPPIPTWYLHSAFKSKDAYAALNALLRPSVERGYNGERDQIFSEALGIQEEDFIDHYPLSHFVDETLLPSLDGRSRAVIDGLAPRDASGLESTDSNVRPLDRLSYLLQPVLVSTFLDSAPSVFVPSSRVGSTEASLVSAAIEIAQLLQNSMTQGQGGDIARLEDLTALLSHVSPYFPFGFSNAGIGIEYEKMLQGMNLRVCEMMSFVALASTTRQVATPSSLLPLEERVQEYVLASLRGEGVRVSQALGRQLSALSYSALLPTVWALLNDSEKRANAVYNAVVEHSIRTSSNSAVKKFTIDFVGRLILIQTSSQYSARFRLSSSMLKKSQEWVTHLPRVLWEVNKNNLSLAETIVQLLLRFVQRRSKVIDAKVSSDLQDRLVPFFVMSVPSGAEVLGPFSWLPSRSTLRCLILDLMVSLAQFSHRKSNTLGMVVDRAVSDTSDERYWKHIQL